MINLQEIPRFGDKLSFLYVEHAVVEQEEKAISFWQETGTISVPVASLATILLGPGTKISHAAIRTLAENNCLVIWCGESGVRFYAQGLGGSRHSRNTILQARLVSNEVTRLQVVVRMYCMRFAEPPDPGLTLQQLRGKEGIRVRQAYAEAARKAGVQWEGRSYKRQEWDGADPVNRALSAANACLYGLVHAAILSGGYSPALGFIHTGKQLSFVYDIADLYKADFTIPLAFEMAAGDHIQLERQVRLACRDRFRKGDLMDRILPDIAKALDVPVAPDDALTDEYAEDSAMPADWWQPATISASLPIGQVLRLDGRAFSGLKETADGRHDPGKGESEPAR